MQIDTKTWGVSDSGFWWNPRDNSGCFGFYLADSYLELSVSAPHISTEATGWPKSTEVVNFMEDQVVVNVSIQPNLPGVINLDLTIQIPCRFKIVFETYEETPRLLIKVIPWPKEQQVVFRASKTVQE